jgi:hypothetical protein
MNRTHLFRTLSLAFVSLTAVAAWAAPADDLKIARALAQTEPQVAVDLAAWLTADDVARLVERDGLVSTDWREQASYLIGTRLAIAEGVLMAEAESDGNEPMFAPALPLAVMAQGGTGR